MVEKSRLKIYDYLYNLFYDVVTKNVYSMNTPQELTESDTRDGFLVLHVGSIFDESEFPCEAFGEVRCYVEAFVPPISRGRLDYNKYEEYENAIDDVIAQAVQDASGTYHIQEDGILSMDDDETANANNAYFTFIKSFIVVIDKQEE